MPFVRTLAIALLLFSHPATACLNLYHVNENGRPSHGMIDLYHFDYEQFNKGELISYYNRMSTELKKKSTPIASSTYYSDYAATLLKAGYYKEGLEIFIYLNKVTPRAYNVVANLGTAYELNGKNDSALYWIKQALILDKHSHRGSEWIHVRILEAKINEKATPGWLKTNRFMPESMLTQETPFNISSALEYQLHERVPFSPAPDAFMAWTLEEFGDYLMKKVSVSEAWKLYAVAKVYSPVFSPQLEGKIGKARQLTETFRKQAKKGDKVQRWPTDKSILELTTKFKNHRVAKIAEIKPVYYH